MTIPDLIADLKSRIDPACSIKIGTKSHERWLCVEALEAQAVEIDRLRPDAELCRRIIEELVRQNHGMTPGWLLDMAPAQPEPRR